jgi:hypothetical protein
MKYDNSFYLQLSREIFKEEYSGMSIRAKWLFVVLNELEQKYCNKNSNFFLRTDKQLCEDTGYSINTLKKAKAELKKYPELVRISRGHWHYTDTGKSSIQQPTSYQILK